MAQPMSQERLPRLETQCKLVLEQIIFLVSNKRDNDSYDKVATVICNLVFETDKWNWYLQ